MEILIAVTHILGSIIALFVLGLIALLIARLEQGRIQKQVAEETSISLGVTVEDLDNKELAPKILKLSAEKFSTELFRNRISDFCGLIRTIWNLLGNITQVLVLLTVVWYTITDSTGNAVYAWFVLGISIAFWFISVIFSLVCKLLTGRYPGQAKETRKVTTEWVKNNSALLKTK